jgi:hypothetical protein
VPPESPLEVEQEVADAQCAAIRDHPEAGAQAAGWPVEARGKRSDRVERAGAHPGRADTDKPALPPLAVEGPLKHGKDPEALSRGKGAQGHLADRQDTEGLH